jgi:hypothetical protein
MSGEKSRLSSISVRPKELPGKFPKSTDDPITLIRSKFKGNDISLNEAMNYVNSVRNIELGDRQIRRYLDNLFRKPGKGIWRIT